MTDPTIFRFLRVLEYVGTREALDLARERRQVKGVHAFTKDCKIFEAIPGDADQPIIGQLKIWCLQQVVKASEGSLYPDDDSMRDGYVNAVHEVLQLTMPDSEYKKLCEGDKT
jgi:hypothetical protein